MNQLSDYSTQDRKETGAGANVQNYELDCGIKIE